MWRGIFLLPQSWGFCPSPGDPSFPEQPAWSSTALNCCVLSTSLDVIPKPLLLRLVLIIPAPVESVREVCSTLYSSVVGTLSSWQDFLKPCRCLICASKYPSVYPICPGWLAADLREVLSSLFKSFMLLFFLQILTNSQS